MNILKLRRRLLVHLLVPLLVFLGSFTALAVFFSQQSGTILWENLVASSLLAAALALFAFICSFSMWTLGLWLAISLAFTLISFLAGWESFTHGIGYLGSCFVSFYCLNQHTPFWFALLMQNAFGTIFFIDIIFSFIFGLRTLIALNAVYPQTRYYIGTFILGLFTTLLPLTQRIPDVPKYGAFQYGVLGVIGLLALISFCFAIFYKRLGARIDRYKRIYGAAVLSCIPLFTTLIPFDVSTADAQKEALIFRIAFGLLAIFCFVYIGFSKHLKRS